MALEQVIRRIKQLFELALETNGRIISIEKQEDGWLAIVETVEVSDFKRQRALNDIVGLYQIKINKYLEVASYKRISLRVRTSLGIEDEDNSFHSEKNILTATSQG